MDIKAEIKNYIEAHGIEAVAVEQGLDVDKVKHWAKLPSFEAVNWYLEKVMLANVLAQPPEVVADAEVGDDLERFLKPHLLPHMQWEGRNLAVLFPTYKDTNPATAWTLVALALDLGRDKARFDMEFGDAQIDNARNKLAHRFLETGAEWSLWLDDDMVAPIGRAGWFKMVCGLPDSFPDAIASQHVVDRLMSHKRKMVGGTYFGRNLQGRAMFAEARTNKVAADAARLMKPTLFPTQWVATGCLLVHRDVYMDIQKKLPELAPTANRPEWDFFRRTSDIGEDIAFCHRARAAGHEIYVDTGCQLQHVGRIGWGAHNTKG